MTPHGKFVSSSEVHFIPNACVYYKSSVYNAVLKFDKELKNNLKIDLLVTKVVIQGGTDAFKKLDGSSIKNDLRLFFSACSVNILIRKIQG